MSKTNALLIKTPEGIVFSQLLAGPITRFTAWLVDLVCLLVLTSAIGMVIGLLSVVSFGIAQAIQIILFFLISIGYRIVLEWHWRGQTIGKRLLRLRVVDAQGLRLQFSQIAIRNLLRFVDAFPLFYLVGGVACLVSRRAQRLGDFAANTVVIRAPKLTEPDLEQLFSGKYNSFREHPHLEARLRQRVPAAEASLALQALLRRDQLDPVARVELFSDLAGHFRSKTQFPAEATDGITDEQYVRNVVDVLYRTRTGAQRGKKSDSSNLSDTSDQSDRAMATIP
jgi:uncharacterized RDD family membrane protein YckC